MKILFDHQIFFLQKYGGISNYFFNLIKLLNKKKIRNKIYAPLYINKYINELKSKNIFGISINLNFFKINFFLNNIFFKKYLTYYKPDIVHFHWIPRLTDIKEMINSNIMFGTQILEAMVLHSVPYFVNTGTYWQHFDGKSYNPNSLYAATKQSFQDILKLACLVLYYFAVRFLLNIEVFFRIKRTVLYLRMI